MPIGNFSGTQLLRGSFRRTGRFGGLDFRWLPGWERNTFDAIKVSGNQYAKMVHQGMVEAMATVSRIPAGGSVETHEDHWIISVGTAPRSHLYWHLLEFGGGRHASRAPIRNAMPRFGEFKPLGRGESP